MGVLYRLFFCGLLMLACKAGNCYCNALQSPETGTIHQLQKQIISVNDPQSGELEEVSAQASSALTQPSTGYRIYTDKISIYYNESLLTKAQESSGYFLSIHIPQQVFHLIYPFHFFW